MPDFIPNCPVDFTLVAEGLSCVFDFFQEPLLRGQNIQDRDMLGPGRHRFIDSAFALGVAIAYAMSVELSPRPDSLYEPLPQRARPIFVDHLSIRQESIVRFDSS